MSSVQVCVDLRQSPSGRFIFSGCRAIFTFVMGVPGKTKWPVAPASATAMFLQSSILQWYNLCVLRRFFWLFWWLIVVLCRCVTLKNSGFLVIILTEDSISVVSNYRGGVQRVLAR